MKWLAMKKNFTYLIIQSLILLGFAFEATAQTKTYNVGAFNFYPGIFKDKNDNIDGFIVETLNSIAKSEGIKFNFVYGSWAEGIDRLQNGEVDLLTCVAFTPERSQFMDYSKETLLTVWSEIYVPTLSNIDAITDLNNKQLD